MRDVTDFEAGKLKALRIGLARKVRKKAPLSFKDRFYGVTILKRQAYSLWTRLRMNFGTDGPGTKNFGGDFFPEDFSLTT